MFFLHKIDFPGKAVNCCLKHTIHILKAIVPAVNLAYLGTLYVHPVICPVFCNILGIIMAVLAETLSYDFLLAGFLFQTQ